MNIKVQGDKENIATFIMRCCCCCNKAKLDALLVLNSGKKSKQNNK